MVTLSQRDSRWNKVRIGLSSSTLGDYGCTITCLAMHAGLLPDEVNMLMGRVEGFSNDLVLWQKINEAIPWLQFEHRYYEYDNDKVLACINKNGGCLVEVDFDGKISTSSDRHWVYFKGDQKLIDPWTGVEKSTSQYPIRKGFAVINVLPRPEAPIQITPINEQTEIDLGEEGKQKVFAIKAMIKDLKRDLLEAQPKAKQLDGFIAKWTQIWNKEVSTTIDDIEVEMRKLIPTEEKAQKYRDEILTCTDPRATPEEKELLYTKDEDLLAKHGLVRKQLVEQAKEIITLETKLNEAKAPSGYKFSKSWKLFGERYIVKMYRKDVNK